MTKQNRIVPIEKIMFLLLAILAIIIVCLSAVTRAFVEKSREEGTCSVVETFTSKREEAPDSPIGVIHVYEFELGNMQHADVLAFYTSHQNIRVYLEEECVYSLIAQASMFRTVGCAWTMIPLYKKETGKTVRIELEPLYADYQNEIPEFLIGSEQTIFKQAFYQALPELILSLCVVLTGVALLCLAIYHSLKRIRVARMYAVGLLAVFTGVWRVTYGRFLYLCLPQYGVLMYTLSVIALMVIGLAMLNSVELSEQEERRWVLQGASIVYSVVYAIELLLQIFGILDLRQMLEITHILLIVSALFLCISSVMEWVRDAAWQKPFFERNYSWLLGIGVLLDLVMYHNEDEMDMLFTLGAILCFTMLEGAKLLIRYMNQQYALEEMETNLILSRTTLMMSQIRSHFVFNLLNAISGMCKYDAEKADDTIVRFARYLRSNIDIMENDKNIPFATDVRQLEDYIILEQVRFGDKIEFYTDIEVENFMIPPLVLQPIVENAIKHGIAKKQSNGTIVLRTREIDGKIVITVEDDGVGFDMNALKNEKSVGIKNIRFRLKHMVNGTLEINSEIGKGTIVTITMPRGGWECT